VEVGFRASAFDHAHRHRVALPAQIQLRPSALASYDVVANVMASAQRNNMLRMGFANVAEFAD